MTKSTKHLKGKREKGILHLDCVEPDEKPKKRKHSNGHWRSRRNTQKRQ